MQGPYVVLTPITKSHPFDERRAHVGPEEDPLKIGRAVARLKPSKENAIFDCKVLSRNHAVMWCREGAFFLRDTKSSNGTFVNNERLAITGEESEARQIFTRDILQFGVEIIENTNKVAHGCIYAMIQLFDVEGHLVETSSTLVTPSLSTSNLGLSSSMVNNHQLFQMQQYLSEAMYREEARQKKLRELEDILASTETLMETARKAVVNEDRLLSKIEALEAQLAVCSKNVSSDKLKEEMLTLVDDKAKFEAMTKESLRRAQEEKAEAELRLADIDRSLVTTEEECNRLRLKLQVVEAQLSDTVAAFDAQQKEHCDTSMALADVERRHAAAQEKLQIAEARADEAIIDRECDKSVPVLVHNLLEALDSGAQVGHEENLAVLANLFRERGIGIPESVPEPPNPMQQENGTESKADVCSTCSTRKNIAEGEAVSNQEVEDYLKENLSLQSRIRELESKLGGDEQSLASTVCAARLELASAHTVSSASTYDTLQSIDTQDDHLMASALLFSLAPFLAVLLCLVLPMYTRYGTASVKKEE